MLFFVFALVCCQTARGGDYLVQGIVRDSVTDEPLGRASVRVEGDSRAVVADGRGLFEIAVSDRARYLTVGCLGYRSKRVPLRRTSHNMYPVYLSPAPKELDEVVVRRAKYSKKNNPAVDFARRIKEAGPEGDPLRRPWYSYGKYDRMELALNNFSAAEHGGLMKSFPYLAEHADTSDVTGRPILGVLLKERASRVYHRSDPRTRKEVVEGIRSEGVDELIDPEATRVFLEDVLREVDLYQSDVTLLQNRFVSPLSALAPDFYRFYLTDTEEMADGSGRCAVLSFYPRNRSSFGFTGHLYVDVADPSMFVRKVEMRLPTETAVNFVDNLYITQTYRRGPGGERFKTSDDLTMELSALGGGKGGNLYARRSTVYSGHSLEALPDSVFASEGPVRELPEAAARDEKFWAEVRMKDVPRGVDRPGLLMERLREKPFVYWSEKVLRTIFTGYVSLGKESPFDIGPVNTLVSFNSVEGTRFRLGGMTTAHLSRRWFGRVYGAWGTRDHRWKYSAEAEYSFIDKDYHAREFPVRSLRLTSQYDVERPGLHYPATSADNIVLSLRRMSDDRAYYRRLNRLEFTWETRTNFSVNAAVANECMEAAPTMPFILGDGTRLARYTQNVCEVTLRYAPGEKFVQGRLHRVPVNMDAPAVSLRHTCSPGGFPGSRYTVNRTVAEVQMRQWLSAFGYVDLYGSAGHVWGRAPFLSLLIPNANISYTIQPRSFALLNPMEFICSTSASWDVSYHAQGALLNLIPWVKRARLREVIGFRGFWGRLDRACDPANDPSLLRFPEGTAVCMPDRRPYMELSAGLENIFKVLRLEYVWRLNYRDVPYEIDRSGLRVALQVSF